MPTHLNRDDRRLPGYSARCAIRRGLAGTTVLALAACGGGGGSSTPPSTGGGGGTAASFYLTGPAGIDQGIGGNVTFADGTTSSGTDLDLEAVTPSTGAGSVLVTRDTWIHPVGIGQWTAAAGSATALGTRYNVYAGTDNRFHVNDLLIGSGGTAPTTATLSNLSTTAVCASTPVVINDLANPANSLLVFDGPPSGQNSCSGAAGDVFSVVPVSAAATSGPSAVGDVEPVDAVRDATGAITSLLLLVHATPPYVAVATGASTASPTKIGNLQGGGLNFPGGSRDFQSLAVIPVSGSAVWLFRDLNNIYGVKLSNPTNVVLAFAGQDEDTVQSAALVDGTVAYVAMVDQTNCPSGYPKCTNEIVRIDAGALAANEGVVLTTEYTTGLQLLGVAGGNLYYAFSDGSALKVITKAAPANSSGSAVFTASGGTTLDLSSLNIPTPPPVVVSGGVYYTVYSGTASGSYLQAWFAAGTTATALGGFSQVLGGVVASSVSSANAGLYANPLSSSSAVPPPYAGALIASMSTANSPPDIYPSATISSYGGSGSATATLGTLPKLVTDEYDAIAVSPGVLQSGVPALLRVSGFDTDSRGGFTGYDLIQITPGTAGSLIQVTTNLQ